ncbi:M23 family metallopeptidase [Patescibacteria group bacterium]|nr:M23 family metallopeptidase [Patescibacteria group bacterium]MBU1123432.1 M23 family metallopeptidase [Patescibacteria group bacterium]
MLEIDIHITHPFKMLFIIGGTVGLVLWGQSYVENKEGSLNAVGGSEIVSVADAEEEIYRQRIEQEVIKNSEEILRYQLRVLEDEKNKNSDLWNEAQASEWSEARSRLIDLLQDRKRSESEIKNALRVLWEAEGRALALSGDASVPLYLTWPVDPEEGLSATFEDEEYERIFGIPHKAIDIPVEQGSEILAASEGVVEVIYQGESGYNYLIIKHAGGATLYGHVLKFMVNEGQYVHRGDRIALSGGMPGTAGAGPLSTGPHLHLEVIRGGGQVDPLGFLPEME